MKEKFVQFVDKKEFQVVTNDILRLRTEIYDFSRAFDQKEVATVTKCMQFVDEKVEELPNKQFLDI